MRHCRLEGLLQLELLEGLSAESLLSGTRRWVGLTLTPFAITAFAGVLSLIGTALLLRSLPVDQAGLLALLLALVESFSLIGSLGQPSMITRLYSASDRGHFDWPRDLAATLGFALIPLGVALAIASIVYDLELVHIVYLAANSLLLIALSSGCFMLNGYGHYKWASTLLRLPNALLLIPGLFTVTSVLSARLPVVLGVYSVGLVLTLVALLAFLLRSLPKGQNRITVQQRFEGLVFLASTGIAFLPDQGLVAIAGAFLQPERLAIYAAIAVLLRPFNVASYILSSIMTPELVRRQRRSYRRLVLGLWAVALSSAVVGAVLGPPVAHWVYSGRYDAGLGLMPILALAGGLQIAAVLPKSDLGGRAPMALLRRLVFVLLAGLSVLTVGGFLLIARLNILGIAITGAALNTLRNAVSYLFWARFRLSETNPIFGDPVGS
jgi:O-antigen/teichoic acid export membrane protein